MNQHQSLRLISALLLNVADPKNFTEEKVDEGARGVLPWAGLVTT